MGITMKILVTLFGMFTIFYLFSPKLNAQTINLPVNNKDNTALRVNSKKNISKDYHNNLESKVQNNQLPNLVQHNETNFNYNYISNPPKNGELTDSLNGPTSYDVLGNFFSQPNVTMQIGLDTLQWYGSGDVNLDGKVDSLDLQAMNNGVTNIEADVDGDGIPSTQADKNLLSDYLTGQIDNLPGWWNKLTTPEERINWV